MKLLPAIIYLCMYVSILLLAVPCYSLEVSFQKQANVTNNHITLGDIATFDEDSDLSVSLATKIIGDSPEPGQTVNFKSLDIVKDILRKTTLSNSTKWSGSPNVAVTRKGQQINADQILQAISDYIQSRKHELPKADISFKPKSLPLPFMLPQGELTWEIIPSSPDIINSSRFSIIIRVDERVRENISVIGEVQAMAPVAVASSNLRRGTILTPSNVILTVRDLSKYKNPCISLRSILGKRLKHTVRSGNVVEGDDVEFPPLVLKGQLVKIVLSHGPLHLSATGVARMNGKLNDIIRVQNTSSNKLIFCRITAPGLVEVGI